MRCAAGELDESVGQWWTEFIEGDPAAREALFTQGGTGDKKPRRRRRRGGAKRAAGGEGSEGAPPGESPSAAGSDS